MVTRSYSVAFQGIEARLIEVQCAMLPGLPAFSIVGLPDKAVSEAKDRIRSALSALSVALPSKRITINLSPADLPKEGGHFDLPIALALLAALDMVQADAVENTIALGELSLDGQLNPVTGALTAALTAAQTGKSLLCPAQVAAEAAWVGNANVFGAPTLAGLLKHLSGDTPIQKAQPGETRREDRTPDLRDVKGQEKAKRALEIAAAGRHNILLIGPPGSGKSMLAARLPGLLPPLTPAEALETSMVQSRAGLLTEGGINRTRPFRDPHHTASIAAIVGGGRSANPGEISLAHNGVLFMDEFPEFSRAVLDSLRQPLETSEVVIARANAHIRYPARFMLIAAANPCKCGYLSNPGRACNKAPMCGRDYMGRISGPLMDRFDMVVDVPAVEISDLDTAQPGEPSQAVSKRVAQAHDMQAKRFKHHTGLYQNADAAGEVLRDITSLDEEGKALLHRAADKFGLSARAYHRVLRVSRTIADLDNAPTIERAHIAEALSYRSHF